jgi:dolichyl-phosphate-mannose--protein O-mannosyl transferase
LAGWRVLAGVAATFLPGFSTPSGRSSPSTVAAVPFLVLAVTLLLGYIRSFGCDPRRRAIERHRRWIVLLIVVMFVYFYPIYSAQVIPYSDWHSRMWFQSWI